MRTTHGTRERGIARVTRHPPARGPSMNIPKPSGTNAKTATEFNAFLNAKHIGKVGAKATLILTGEARMVDSQFGPQIVASVKLGKLSYDWGIRIDSPNHRILYDRFSAKPKTWKNKKVRVTVNPPMQKGMHPYIAIER